MYTALTSLDATLRDSAALLKRAEVAGMEASGPIFDLKSKGTTAAVEARALIHSFDPERLLKRIAEGEAVGTSARKAGVAALAELQFRRKGWPSPSSSSASSSSLCSSRSARGGG